MDHMSIPGGHRWDLEDGSAIEVLDIDWSQSGRLYVNVLAFSEGGSLGGGKLELSNSGERYKLAREIASHNGTNPQPWADVLLAVWTGMDEQRRSGIERFAPVNLTDYDEPEPMRDTIEKMVPELVTTEWYGDNGQCKSILVAGMCTCISMGFDFLGLATLMGPTVILDWELSRDITLGRLYKIARGYGLTRPPSIFYQSMASPLGQNLPDIMTWCENVKPSLVCVDSMGPASGGDPGDHAKVIDLMSKLRLIKATSLVVDHQSKPTGAQSYSSKRSFGSGYKGHLARSSIQVEMVSNVPGKASVVLRHQKNNFGPKIAPMAVHVIFDSNAIKFQVADIAEAEFQDTDAIPNEMKIKRYLQEAGEGTKEQIMEEIGIASSGSFDNAVTKLRKTGGMPAQLARTEGGNRIYRLL